MASTVSNGNDCSEKWHRPFQMATTVYEREICVTAIEHFHAELRKTSICCVTHRLSVGIIQARCSCCLLDNNFIIICRPLWLFASFDRIFFKHSITTCKSTSLSIECCRRLIAWLVKLIKNEKLRIFRAELLLISQLMLLQTQLLGVTKQENLTDLVSCSNGNK